MLDTKLNCLTTFHGSLPHKDADKACQLVAKYLPDLPAFPQLSKRAYRENMYAQCSEGFPGIVVTDDKIYVDSKQDLTGQLAQFYTDYMANDISRYGISYEYGAGFHTFLKMKGLKPRAVKGHITGPVTWGLTVPDVEGKGILYDETLGDVVPKFLRLKAAWIERELCKMNPNTIMFVDEPYLTAFGSVGMQLTKEQVIDCLEETYRGIKGLKGTHCCGNTDWAILLQTSVDIISFDTYNFAESLAIYPQEVKNFLARGGCIAWGIVPTDAETVNKETVHSLKDRLEAALALFTRKGIPINQLLEQGLITPACGLGPISSEAAAERALQLTAELSKEIRNKYNLA
ncbi:MAG: methionine synthase [Dehalococcoidales bacterium]|nr:methionine synthase [Dehalococcoidales bacterium]